MRSTKNRTARFGRRQTLRYLTATSCVSWMRLEDSHEILRDGKHSTRKHRRKQNESKRFNDLGTVLSYKEIQSDTKTWKGFVFVIYRVASCVSSMTNATERDSINLYNPDAMFY